ncbi:MAG: response regulator receiver and ANTAR domain protein, partial [uncultured Blastococcus sp.]
EREPVTEPAPDRGTVRGVRADVRAAAVRGDGGELAGSALRAGPRDGARSVRSGRQHHRRARAALLRQHRRAGGAGRRPAVRAGRGAVPDGVRDPRTSEDGRPGHGYPVAALDRGSRAPGAARRHERAHGRRGRLRGGAEGVCRGAGHLRRGRREPVAALRLPVRDLRHQPADARACRPAQRGHACGLPEPGLPQHGQGPAHGTRRRGRGDGLPDTARPRPEGGHERRPDRAAPDRIRRPTGPV